MVGLWHTCLLPTQVRLLTVLHVVIVTGETTEFYLLPVQLQVAEASFADRSSYESWRENELQQRCTKYEQFAELYRTQRVRSSSGRSQRRNLFPIMTWRLGNKYTQAYVLASFAET